MMKYGSFRIIKNVGRYLGVSALLACLAIWFFFQNMRFSIQFTGGVEVVFDGKAQENVVNHVRVALESRGYDDFSLSVGDKDGYGSLLVQMDIDNDEKVQVVSDIVRDGLLETNSIEDIKDIVEFSLIGPSIGDYIQKTAKSALIWGVVLMAVYILFAFSEMRGLVSPALLGVVTILTMLFDVSIAAGAYGILMKINHAVQIDTIFVLALLTVLGYSINDTIVIFDRVRENFLDKQGSLEKGTISHEDIFEMSLWQSMRRSLATSISTLLVVFAMYVFGTGVLRLFAFTLGMGVIAGTYSSLFLATPMAYILSVWKKNNKQ